NAVNGGVRVVSRDERMGELCSGGWKVEGGVLVVHGNTQARAVEIRYCNGDMNRRFGGRGQSFAESDATRRARELELSLETCFSSGQARVRWQLDLHTAIRGAQHCRFWVLPPRDRPAERDCRSGLGGAGRAGGGLTAAAG
ncbi:succinylglutamate desuccinylase/aspartoacylase family protein, partial [Salmonella enterica]|uniref:succinylglutamate desuccinylase/aspartoacylase domain-containing protein n=1 Tax=Salmonella enterica TaxID=28901 RepID=UPI00398C4A21